MPTDLNTLLYSVSFLMMTVGATLAVVRWRLGVSILLFGLMVLFYAARGFYLPHLIALQTATAENETIKTVVVWNRKIIPFLAVVAWTGLIGMVAFILWALAKVRRQERRRPPRF